MKIKTTSGKEIDTTKLTDRDAEITEAVNNLYNVCQRYNLTMVSRVIVNENGYVGCENVMTGDKNKINDSKLFLLGVLNKYVIEKTNGEIMLVKVGPNQEDYPDDNS